MGLEHRGAFERLSSAQLGLLTWPQLLELGVPRERLRQRLQSGEWQRIYRGVYRVGTGRVTLETRELAALLALGPDAVLSHFSAAQHWGFAPRTLTAIHVRIPWSVRRTALMGVTLHRGRALQPGDTDRRGALRWTNPATTLVDLAGLLDELELHTAVNEALRRRGPTHHETLALLGDSAQGVVGGGLLRKLLLDVNPSNLPDSGFESLVLRLVQSLSERPHLHYPVIEQDHFVAELDFAWPQLRLGLELDGWHFHGGPVSFERDQARILALQESGWDIRRFPWRMVRDRPKDFVRRMEKVLSESRQPLLSAPARAERLAPRAPAEFPRENSSSLETRY